MNIDKKSEIRRFQQFIKDAMEQETYGVDAHEFTEERWLEEYLVSIGLSLIETDITNLAEHVTNAKQGKLLERRISNRNDYHAEVRAHNLSEENRINQEACDQF